MLRKLRVCQVTAAYHPYPSGVSEYVSNLSQALRARGHDVHVLTTGYDRLKGLNRSSEPESGVTRIGQARLLPLNRSFATVPLDWHMSGKVRRFLAEHEFDVLHLNGFFPPDISFYALKHSRCVNVLMFHTVGFVTPGLHQQIAQIATDGQSAQKGNPSADCADYTDSNLRESAKSVDRRGESSRAAAWLFRKTFARYLRRLHGRIAATEGARRFIAPFFPEEIRVIHEGVNTDRFKPGVAPEECGAGRILFVGRLDARKGLSVLLRALPLVRASLPYVQLLIVGSGPMEPEARQLTARTGLRDAVTFLGTVPGSSLPGYYTSADVFCAPTLGGEAFGLVLLEAMASGTPVVASDITGYNEVVTHGETGLLCPPGNPTALAEALVQALTDRQLRARLQANGLAWARLHAWPNIAAQVESYYFELLDRSKRTEDSR